MKIKCPYCTRMVEITKKKRIGQHANLPRKVCLGSGQPARTAQFLNDRNKEAKGCGADAVSNATGWCVNSLCVKEINNKD